MMVKGMRDGAYRTAGTGLAVYGAALLVKANEVAIRTLIDTLGGGPTIHRIIDIIIRTVS